LKDKVPGVTGIATLFRVIPREGVERFTIFNRFELVDHVIPREGVERCMAMSGRMTPRAISDPERGS